MPFNGYIPSEAKPEADPKRLWLSMKKFFWVSVGLAFLICLLELTNLLPYFMSGIRFPDSLRVHMSEVSAVCFLLALFSLVLVYLNQPTTLRIIIPVFSGLFLITVSIFTLSTWATVIKTGTEPAITIKPVIKLFLSQSSRMAMFSASIFFFLGIIIILIAQKQKLYSNLAHYLCIPLSVSSYIIPVSYILNVDFVHGIAHAPVSLSSGIVFCATCLAVFFLKPDTWFMQIFTSPNTGGIMARKLLPWLAILPVVISWLRMQGEHSGFYDPDVGTFLIEITYTFCFLALVWIIAGSVNTIDKERHSANDALKRSYEEMESRIEERTSELVELNKALDNEIRERIKAEALVEAERQRTVGLLEKMPAYMILLTPDHRVAYSNQYFRENFGESLGRPCYEFLFGRSEPCEVCETFETLKDGMPHTWEWVGPNNHIYSIYDFPYSDNDGSQLIMEMGIDVTELKETQARLVMLNAELEQKVEERAFELLKANERLDILSQTSGKLLESDNPSAIINSICQRIMQFLDCQVFTNYLVDEKSGRQHLNTYAGIPEETAKIYEWLEPGIGVTGSVARDGAGIVAEDVQEMTDTRTELIRSFGMQAFVCFPLLTHGKVTGTLSFGSVTRNKFADDDVSLIKSVADEIAVAIARIKNEESLRASEERYRSLMELSPSAILVIRKSRVVLVNSAARKLFGENSANMILGKTHFELFHPDYHNLIRTRTEKVLKGETVGMVDEKIIRADGTIRDVEVITSAITDSGEPATEVIMNDITDRVNAEIALKESARRLELALETANIGTWEWEIDTGKVFLDERMEKMFGKKPGKFEYTYKVFEETLHDDDLEHVRQSLKQSLESDKPFDTVYRIKSGHGNISYVSSRALIEKNEIGKPVKMSGVCFDITDMKKGAEKAILELNENLLRSNRELEQFAYVASHDLQEPLRMVSSFTQLLQQKYSEKLDHEAHEFIQYAVDGAIRMKNLINDLLNYSRVGTRGKSFSDVDMHSVLGQVIFNLNLKITEKNAIVTSDALPEVYADEGQMIQLMQNLVMNALKFCDGSPIVHISAGEENEHFVFSVKDNGIGMDRQYFDKIFQIFQRLHSHEEYGGTGIGLAICNRIVERHGGKIWVESEPGKGSVFYFTIKRKT